jgi:hypothetical protein
MIARKDWVCLVSRSCSTERLRGFRQRLKDTGYVEGENVAIEFRWAEDDSRRRLAGDAIHRARLATLQPPPFQ